jgi:hypothetical protein
LENVCKGKEFYLTNGLLWIKKMNDGPDSYRDGMMGHWNDGPSTPSACMHKYELIVLFVTGRQAQGDKNGILE